MINVRKGQLSKAGQVRLESSLNSVVYKRCFALCNIVVKCLLVIPSLNLQ